LEWFPFVAFLIAYDIARTFADRLMPTHVRAPLDWDRLLFVGHVPTLSLQHRLWHGAEDVRWYDYASWGIYMTFFFATLIVAALLWIFAYHRFRRYVAMVGVLTIFGFITYVLFPAAPPWYAAKLGELPAAPRLTADVWSHTFVSVSKVVDHGQGLSNYVAAMPSLHAGFTLLISLFLWRPARWYWRILLVLYPLLMGFTLVYFAEHYVVDVLAGWVYAAAAFVTVEWWVRRKSNRIAVIKVGAPPKGRGTPA
jgi:membrane-associated phospholipid phosphatase